MGLAKLSPDAAPIAREVYRRMLERGMNQKSLARAAGVNETYVRDLYSAKSRNPKAGQLTKIAGVLGCSIEDLIGPAGAGAPDTRREVVDDPEELAWLELWRAMNDDGRAGALQVLDVAIPKLASRRKVE